MDKLSQWIDETEARVERDARELRAASTSWGASE